MKIKKILKNSLFAIGGIAPLTTAGLVVVSCGSHKKNPPAKTDFGTFTQLAEAASASDIVRHASATPTAWSSLTGFSKVGQPTVTTNTVIITIQESTTKEVAVFTATYTTGQAYKLSDWACTTPPAKAETFANFKIAAESGGTAIIFGEIQKAAPSGINVNLAAIDGKNLKLDTSSGFSDKDNIITFKLVFVKRTNPASYLNDGEKITIALTNKFNQVAYDVKQWTAPDYTFAQFQTAATANVKTAAWKSYAVGLINAKTDGSHNWVADNTSTVGEVVVKKQSLSVKITHLSTSESSIVTINFDKDAKNKVSLYGQDDWTATKPAVDTWSKFQQAVKTWGANGPDTITLWRSVLKKLSANSKFPDEWKGKITNPSDVQIYRAIPTTGKSPDETNHILYYTINYVEQSTTNRVLNVDIKQNTIEDLTADNFTISATQPPPPNKNKKWIKDATNILIAANTNEDYSYDIVQSIYSANQNNQNDDKRNKGNLATFFINNKVGDAKSNVRVIINTDPTSFNYNPKGGWPGQEDGQLTFKLQFSLKASPTTPATTGGLFYLDRHSEQIKPDSSWFQYMGTAQDIN